MARETLMLGQMMFSHPVLLQLRENTRGQLSVWLLVHRRVIVSLLPCHNRTLASPRGMHASTSP